MCRHLAYVGPPRTIRALVTDPPYGLHQQSWAPRMQKYGTVNADGFGIGWYADGDPVPARYRRSGPIWADPSFADLARVVHTRALLAAVRSATDGCAPGEAAAAPYTADQWLFSHNGALPGWPAAFADLAATLPPADLLALEARCDSALVWALVLRRLRDGAAPGEALAATVRDIAARADARLNLLLTDGTLIAATTWGDTLFHRLEPGRCALVASEPGDDLPGWTPVPDGSLLLATADAVTVRPLAGPPG
ncbi:ergothioneine biosynthesis protein EgtC [Peterkaempfera bronchialis]|uniref:ergothioneine biosynthesis protein EgtC n=1 Tax=Peterkaempfera bronchialis TaxID=2126346 RepID=UPI003C2C877F